MTVVKGKFWAFKILVFKLRFKICFELINLRVSTRNSLALSNEILQNANDNTTTTEIDWKWFNQGKK